MEQILHPGLLQVRELLGVGRIMGAEIDVNNEFVVGGGVAGSD